MKKIFSTCILAASLLTMSPMASAMDGVTLCPSLLAFKDASIDSVSKDYNSNNRFTVSTSRQIVDNSADLNRTEYTYTDYTFAVHGVKAANASEAIQKVQKALAAAIETHPDALSIQPMSYGNYNCNYALDFSDDGSDYNNAFPTAVVELYGSTTQNLFVLPKDLSVKK